MPSIPLTAAVLDRRGAVRLTAASLLAGVVVAAAAPAALAAPAGLAPILQNTPVLASADPSARAKFSLTIGVLVSFTGNRKNGYTGVSHARGYGWVPDSAVGRPGEVALARTVRAVEVMSRLDSSAVAQFRLAQGSVVGLTGSRRNGLVGVTHEWGYGWVPADALGAAYSGPKPGPGPAPSGFGQTAVTVQVHSTSDKASAVKFSLSAGTIVRFLGTRRGMMVGVSHPLGYGWVPRDLVDATGRTGLPATEYFQSHTAEGRTYGYHVVADGIDLSRPVGVVVYLEGDYWYDSSSLYKVPSGPKLTAIAAEANRRNMVVVVPQTPRPRRTGYGYIWWWPSERPGNNVWLTSLLSDLYTRFPMLYPSRHWFLGYSGGAEFATFEFFARSPESVMSGGGAVLVAGGGMYDDPGMPQFFALPSSGFRQRVWLQWFVGDRDGTGSTVPETWSALRATERGERVYREAGFTRTSRTVLAGLDHGDYNLAELLGRGLEAGGIARLR